MINLHKMIRVIFFLCLFQTLLVAFAQSKPDLRFFRDIGIKHKYIDNELLLMIQGLDETNKDTVVILSITENFDYSDTFLVAKLYISNNVYHYITENYTINYTLNEQKNLIRYVKYDYQSKDTTILTYLYDNNSLMAYSRTLHTSDRYKIGKRDTITEEYFIIVKNDSVDEIFYVYNSDTILYYTIRYLGDGTIVQKNNYYTYTYNFFGENIFTVRGINPLGNNLLSGTIDDQYRIQSYSSYLELDGGPELIACVRLTTLSGRVLEKMSLDVYDTEQIVYKYDKTNSTLCEIVVIKNCKLMEHRMFYYK